MSPSVTDEAFVFFNSFDRSPRIRNNLLLKASNGTDGIRGGPNFLRL